MTARPLLGLRPRPEPEAAVLVAIAAALEQTRPRPAGEADWRRGHSAWRFSGRWWNRPIPLRRERPGGGY